MKLRKILKSALIAGIISFASVSAFAQGAYLKLGVGYNFGLGGDIDYNTKTILNSTPGNTSIVSTKFERITINYGKGKIANGAFGYMFTKHFGTELGFGYLYGTEIETKDVQRTNDGQVAGSNFPYRSLSYSRMLLVQPALVIAADIEKVNPYTRIGLVVAKGTVFQSSLFQVPNGAARRDIEYSGGPALGFQASLGVDFKLLDEKCVIFTEAIFTSLQYSPDEGKVTKYDINSKDQLQDLPVSQKEIKFSDNFEIDNTNPPPDSSPGQQKKFNLPFSSVAIQIGMKIKL